MMIPHSSHEETPRVPGQYKQEQHSSDDDEFPPSSTPQPKEKKPEPTTTPEKTPVMAEKFKVPKPRTYTRDNGDRDASTLDAWIQKLKNYLELSGVHENKNQILVMQSFLSGTTEKFYHTKQLTGTTIDFDQFLTDLRKHIVSSTDINRYWDGWYKISHVRKGRAVRINATAIRMEMVAARLGEAITNAVKIQRFLDAMHPELRYAVEPDIQDRSKANWDDVKQLAERKDAALFQAGRYGRSQPCGPRQSHQQSFSSNANASHWRTNTNNQGGRGNSGKSSFKRLTDNEKAQLRKDRKCFYCKKPGHIFNDCRARQRNQQNGKYVQSAQTTVDIEEDLPDTVEEFIESVRTTDNSQGKVNNMVTNMIINCNSGGRSLESQGTRAEGRLMTGARYVDTGCKDDGCKDDGCKDDGCKAYIVDYKRRGLGLVVR
jgi:hypothetical protein